jgi:adenosylcobinamide-GDP ribazoletransferase
VLEGLRLAASWLTVLPVRGPDSVDRDDGRRVIAATPVIGLVLGAMVAVVAWVATVAGLPAPLAGFLAVAAHALATRGMHIDGLSDTVDGLGCYGPPERAQAVMKSGGAGPFGVAALILTLGSGAVAIGELADRGWYAAIVIALLTSRVAVVGSCRVGITAANESGFGSLVAGTQRLGVVAAWSVVALAAGAMATPDRWWLGVVAVAAALAFAAVFTRHCVRRFGGLVGDVLGAVIESTTVLILVVCLV